jgi:hypothetical protein
MNEKLGITTILGLYGLLVSACYLMAYWGAFDVDIFQLAGLTDFVKLAIYPVSFVIMIGVVVMTASSLLFSLLPNYEQIFIRQSTRKTLQVFMLVVTSASGLVLLFAHGNWKWPVGTGGLATAPALYICTHPRALKYIPDRSLRLVVAFFVLWMPLLAAFAGANQSERIKDGTSQRIIDNTGVAAGLIATPEHPLMYIGFVSDTFVIYETQTRSVVLVKQVDNAPLVLKPNPRAYVPSRASWKAILELNPSKTP